LERAYGQNPGLKLKPLLFAVHTYSALLMKLLAMELASLQRGSIMPSPIRQLPSSNPSDLRKRLVDLESGGLFVRLGIHNFLEGDFFGWYLETWNDQIAEGVREMARSLGEFEPATGSLEPAITRDLLKRLYQYLVPKELRHDLGEYYTPDWLAELILDEVGYHGQLGQRILDPACGSGTFLVLAIQRARAYADENLLDPGPTINQILRNIVGFDLNPLAVIAARTNYLLALGNLVSYQSNLEIPIYLCDSVLTPVAHDVTQLTLGHDYTVPSSAGTFRVPAAIVEGQALGKLTSILEECVAADYRPQEFVDRARRELPLEDPSTLDELYRTLRNLKRERKNGVWARIIQNAFAPVFAGRFDYVVGNPPWIGWESLSDDYRDATVALWKEYGLFSLKGHAARLGGGKKDLSMLMLYVSADRYLADKGQLGFVITQSVLKTKGAGDGFRRFRVGTGGAQLGVLKAHDFTDVQPFEGAHTLTAAMIVEKGRRTTYPVPYIKWKRIKGVRRLRMDRDGMASGVVRNNWAAKPVSASKPTSPWITAPAEAIKALDRVMRPSYYRGYAGACTWANGVYWLRVLGARPDGLLMVENLHEEGDLTVPRIQTVIEPDLVYPFLRGRGVGRWSAKPSDYILVPQNPVTRTGVDESWMKVHLPRTYSYLLQFRDILERRAGYKKFFDPDKDPFYSIYDVGEYTFAPYRVMWRQMVRRINATVVGSKADEALGEKRLVTQHVVTLVPFQDEEEAFYFCAVMNSSMASLVSSSYSTGKSFGTPTVLHYVGVPKYDSQKKVHRSLAALARQAHELGSDRAEHEAHLASLSQEVDLLAGQLWGLSAEDVEVLAQVT
jgi:methylase of polypeptide subunit release factors